MSGMLSRIAGLEHHVDNLRLRFDELVERLGTGVDAMMRDLRDQASDALEGKAEAAVRKTIAALEERGESVLVRISAALTELEARVAVLEARVADLGIKAALDLAGVPQ